MTVTPFWVGMCSRTFLALVFLMGLDGFGVNTGWADEQLTPEEVERWVEKGRDVADLDRYAETGLGADGKPLREHGQQYYRNKANRTKNVEVNFTDSTRRNIFWYAYYQRQEEQLNRDKNSMDENDPRRQDIEQDLQEVDQQRDAQLTENDQEEILRLVKEAEIIATIQREERAVERGEAELARAEADGVEAFRLGLIKNDLREDQRDVELWRNALRKFRQLYGTRFPDYQIPNAQDQGDSGSGDNSSMGNGAPLTNIPISGQTGIQGGQGSFELSITGGFRFPDETPENFLRTLDQSEGQPPSDSPKKEWTGTDSQSSLFLELNPGDTFNVDYTVDSSRKNEESTVFLTAGTQNFIEEWNTVIPKNYAGLAFENIDLTVDVTSTYITSLVPGVDPWNFQQQSIQQGFDLSRWDGSNLPFGAYLEWAVDPETFNRFIQQNGALIQFSEHDAATNIAPVPAWHSRDWPSPVEANPLPYLRFDR